jgi:hypothetical protein
MADRIWHDALKRNPDEHTLTDSEAVLIESHAQWLHRHLGTPLEQARYQAERKFNLGLLKG